jgi:hypothetical protein
MNKQIKKLAEQATRSEEPDGLFPREVFDIEKFAELIIKECLEIADKNRTGMEIKTNTHLTADAIKKYFGVEL